MLILSDLLICLNIDDFGAKPNDNSFDAAVINGKAIFNAINAANNGSDRTVVIDGKGGKVYTMVPAGYIVDLVNVTIQFDGRINAWDGDKSKWPQSENGNSIPMFSITNTQNMIIRGNGVVDGFGYSWWWDVILGGHDNRPRMFAISSGINTLIDGISLFNSPQFHMSFYNQINSTVQNVRVHVNITDDEVSFLKWLPTFPLNTDGIDISGKNIHLRNLTIQNFDDAVAVKPLKAFDDPYTNCTEDIIVEDSFVKYGVGMSIGSVPPDTNFECVRNVTFRNIKFDKPLKAIYVKPNPGNLGLGIIKNVTYENIGKISL